MCSRKKRDCSQPRFLFEPDGGRFAIFDFREKIADIYGDAKKKYFFLKFFFATQLNVKPAR